MSRNYKDRTRAGAATAAIWIRNRYGNSYLSFEGETLLDSLQLRRLEIVFFTKISPPLYPYEISQVDTKDTFLFSQLTVRSKNYLTHQNRPIHNFPWYVVIGEGKT